MEDDVMNPLSGAMPGNVEEQLKSTTEATQAKIAGVKAVRTQKDPTQRKTTEELYEMIRPKKNVTKGTAASIIHPQPVYSNGDEGVAYSSYRDDAMSPATEVRSGIKTTATSDMSKYDIGGRVAPGMQIYAENPLYDGEESTFYLKRKFAPVKPYPLTLPTGDTVEVDTANKKKAAYLAITMTQPDSDIDWFGYDRVLSPVHENFWHGVARGVVNAVPGLIVGSAAYLRQAGLDIWSLFSDESPEYWANVRKMAKQAADDLLEDVTWQYGPEGVGDRDGNKAGYILGNAAGSVFPAFMGGRALLPVINTLEALESGNQIRSAMIDKGVSASKGFWTALGGAAGVLAIGMTPEAANKVMEFYGRPAKFMDDLARMHPKIFDKLMLERRLVMAAIEGIAEPGQDYFANTLAGEEHDWESYGWTFLWSMLLSSAAMALSKDTTAQKRTEQKAKYKQFFLQHLDRFRDAATGSFGAITTDNIDVILDQVMSPESGTALNNMLKEAMVANFDKVSDEDKKRLQDYVKKINPNSSLEKEMDVLNQRVDKLLKESHDAAVADGKTPLTSNQEALVRLMLGGVAAKQLTDLGILPSQMVLPPRVNGNIAEEITKEAGDNVVGVTNESGISVNNDAPGAALPQVATEVDATEATSVSTRVQNELAEAGVTSPQSLSFGGLSHEFWHWMEDYTGLKNVGAFYETARNIVEQIVPGLTEGKTGAELSEAFAYGMQYAGDRAKSILGLDGKTKDYIEFMTLVANAEQIATGTVQKLRGYMQSLQKVLKNNQKLIDDILKDYSTGQVRNAVKNFIKNGDSAPLTFENLRDLHAAVSSMGGTSTSDSLSKIFESGQQIDTFLDKYAKQYDELMAKDRNMAALQLAAYKKIADQKVGVTPAINPGNFRQIRGTSESKMAELVAQDKKPAQPKKEAPKQPETQPTPEAEAEQKQAPANTDDIVERTYTREVRGEEGRVGKSYGLDSLLKNNMTKDDVIGYYERVTQWARVAGLTMSKINQRNATVDIVNGKPVVGVDKTFGNTKLDHRAAYVLLGREKLRDMYKAGQLSDVDVARIQNMSKFAVANRVAAAYRGNPMEYLAIKVAEGTATPDEEALHTAFSQFEAELSDIYVDYGPYDPEEQDIAARTSAVELAESLVILYHSTTDDIVKRIINGSPVEEGILREALPENVVYRAYVGTTSGRSILDILNDYIGVLDRAIEDPTNAVYDEYMKLTRAEERKLEDARKRVEDLSKIAKRTPKQEAALQNTRQYLADFAKNKVASQTKSLLSFFRPDYNTDISERYVNKRAVAAAYAALRKAGLPAEQREGALRIISEWRTLSKTSNAIRGFLRRDAIHSPTPLEELGISMEEAEAKIREGGLEPYNFLEGELGQFVRDNFSSENVRNMINTDTAMTRRSIMATLLNQIPNIGENATEAEMMRVLHAISSVRDIANQLFADSINSEDTFDMNPTMSPRAVLSGREFAKTEQFENKLREHVEMGYTVPVRANMLDVGSEVAFPYGNMMRRAVVVYKFETPSGAVGYVMYGDVDVNEWKQKDLTRVAPPQYVISEKDILGSGAITKIGADAAKVENLISLFDKVSIDRDLLRAFSEASIYVNPSESVSPYNEKGFIDYRKEMAENKQDNKDRRRDLFNRSMTPGTVFAVGGLPVVDPGVFIINKDLEELAQEAPEMLGRLNIEDEGYWQEENSSFDADVARLELVQPLDANFEKSQAKKARFRDVYKNMLKTIKEFRESLSERNFTKLDKMLLLGGWGSSLDRKMRMVLGGAYSRLFNTIDASSRAQTYSEGFRHAYDKALMDNVFNSSRADYERYLVRMHTDQFKTQTKAYVDKYGRDVKSMDIDITRGEILSIAMAKRAVEKGLINIEEDTNPYERMQKFYADTESLLDNLTEQDWKFVDVSLLALANARGISAYLPDYWPPCILADQALENWAHRPTKNPDNSAAILFSEDRLAATDAFDSILSIMGTKAMADSGYTTQLRLLKTAFRFRDVVNKDDFKAFDKADDMLYEELKNESEWLTKELNEKIGPTFSKWLMDNIDVDSKFNPLVKELAANPVLSTFQKLTRSVATSLLSLSPKQGLVNIGNYHLFAGLSNSSVLRFYTTDYANAWAHLKEAWQLALQNAEFKRRLQQSGLSEQMRRVVDMNDESLLRDIQEALNNNGKTRLGDKVGMLNSLAKVSAKYGLAMNVIPDFIGIALGNYAVYNDVLMRNKGDVNSTKKEIASFILNRASSSNYATRSAATKLLNRAGLEALVMFKNDQLLRTGMLAEAILNLRHSSDPVVRQQAIKDISAWTYTTLRYVAIQAGWVMALAQVMSGDDLSDEQEEYILDATLREFIGQVGDSTVIGSFVTPVLNSIFFGTRAGLSDAVSGQLQRQIAAYRKGDILTGATNTLGVTVGLMPPAPAILRILDAFSRIASDDEREQRVGMMMLAGRSENTAQEMLGYSRGRVSGKLQDKKSKKNE